MTSSGENDTSPARQYQTQCLRDPRLDDVDYSNTTPQEQSGGIQLRRAYVVAAVLFGVNLLIAVGTSIYVVAISVSRLDGSSSSSSSGNWSICCPRNNWTTGACCAMVANNDFACTTITAAVYIARVGFITAIVSYSCKSVE